LKKFKTSRKVDWFSFIFGVSNKTNFMEASIIPGTWSYKHGYYRADSEHIYLEKGRFYKHGKSIYLIGAKVPDIANLYVSKISKTGKVSEPTAIYYRQSKSAFKLCQPVQINIKSKEILIRLFCSDYYHMSSSSFPNVDVYFEKPKKQKLTPKPIPFMNGMIHWPSIGN
jgi:hypothetical protein